MPTHICSSASGNNFASPTDQFGSVGVGACISTSSVAQFEPLTERLVKHFMPVAIVVFASMLMSACSDSPLESVVKRDYPHDFSTPQGAIRCLEDAYQQHDLEAAIRCKDFPVEARLLLKFKGTGQADNPLIVAQFAAELESMFRQNIPIAWPVPPSRDSFFVDQEGVSFPDTFSGRIDRVCEGFRHVDGRITVFWYYVVETNDGWRVLNVEERL